MTAAARIVLVLGGTRSGKSAFAERLAAQAAHTAGDDHVVYIATAGPDAEGMTDRIAAHRARRPPDWVTVETTDLSGTLARHPDGTVLVDSLGTWLTGHRDFAADHGALVRALSVRRGVTVVVSEEVGLAVHPETELGRRFVDAIGDLNQAIAAVAADVVLVVAGRAMWLPREPR